MNINIYIEDALAKQLAQQAHLLGESRNALIRQAIREYLSQQKTAKWPHSVRTFRGIPDFPAFESYRSELSPPKEDPFE